MEKSKYIIGIDLGTTHCVLAYTDTRIPEDKEPDIRIFSVPQVSNPGEIKSQPLLPSFVFLPGPHDVPEKGLSLPWDPEEKEQAVGEFARVRGPNFPTGSWLRVNHGFVTVG